MKAIKVTANLNNRDASLSELKKEDFINVHISKYIHHAETQIDGIDGKYSSLQGPNLTPQPFWCIEFSTIIRSVSNNQFIVPKKEEGNYVLSTARWVKVEGTGTTKEKWREDDIRISGRLSRENLFCAISSSWLVPFCIAHRFLVHIPFRIQSQNKNSTLHSILLNNSTIDAFLKNPKKNKSSEISKWTETAQKIWSSLKTEKSSDSVIDWLDYHGKMSKQAPRSIRVVHTRSRKLYAAVLNPQSDTALGMNLSRAYIGERKDGKITHIKELGLSGCIVDNMLHYIPVNSTGEAYWLVGLLNSKPFENKIMKLAGGERGQEYVPSIYSLPAKLLNEYEIIFDSKNKHDVEISKIAKELEKEMTKIVVEYLTEKKGFKMDSLDDTNASPEVVSTIMTPYVARLREKFSEKLNRLDELVEMKF